MISIPGVVCPEAVQKFDELHRRDRAHDTKCEIAPSQLEEARRRLLYLPSAHHDFGQVWFYQPTELGHVGIVRLATEQQAAELILHFSDGTRQGRLTDMTCLRRLGEVECLAQCEKIADFLEFHPCYSLT